MRPIRGEDDIFELVRSSQLLATIASWHSAGLFEALREGPVALEALEGDPRALRITATILRHARLLGGDETHVALTRRARDLLDAGALPGEVTFGRLEGLARLPEVLRTGAPLTTTSGGVRLEDPQASRAFLDMLYRMSEDSARETVAWVARELPDGARVLDLGGGHGRYARAFAELGYEATLMDFPMVVGFARERHGDAVSYLEGDFLAGDDVGGPWDAVLLSNIVHGQSAAQNASLVARLAATLRPGGRIVLKDMFLDAFGRDSTEAAMFGMTMLLNTTAGRSYSTDEARGWLLDAGLAQVDAVVFDSHSLVIGHNAPRA